MKGEYDYGEWGKKLKESFEILKFKPKDRLEYLTASFRIRDVMVAALGLMEPLADVELSHQYPMEDLETLYKSLIKSATPLRDMLWHFYRKSQRERESFAV